MLSRSLDLRLSVLFSLFFLVGIAVIFTAAYALQVASIEQEERSVLDSRLHEIEGLYRSGGVALVAQELERETSEWSVWRIAVRISDSEGRTLLIDRPAGFPPGWELALEARGDSGVPRRVRLDETSTTLLVVGSPQPDGVNIQCGIDHSVGEGMLARFRRIFLIVTLPAVLIGFAGGFLFASRALRPIRRLVATMRTIIDTGSLHTRIPEPNTTDDLRELSRLFNVMLSRIDELVQGMRTSLDNVAHEIRTPLTRIQTGAEVAIQEEVDSGRWRQGLEDVIEQSSGLLRLTRALMDISEAQTRTMRLDLELCDVSSVISDVAEFYEYMAEEDGIEFAESVTEGIECRIDISRMRQVLSNLLDNAVKYTQSGGSIEIRAHLQTGSLVVEVIDSGVGIRKDELEQIWDRLYRGAHTRHTKGLGIGLALAQAIVKAHGGALTVTSDVGRGSTFRITLPCDGAGRHASSTSILTKR